MSKEEMKKELNESARLINDKKKLMMPFLAEKMGVNAMLEEERTKLTDLLAQKEELDKTRARLMDATWEKDAEDINRAFNKKSQDKSVIVSIMANRTLWQARAIAAKYERKTGKVLAETVVNEMTTVLGTLGITSGNTSLSKLLMYRILGQAERDGALLRDFSDGISLMDEEMWEIIVSRNNAELKGAIEAYSKEYRKDLPTIASKKISYKNYRAFMVEVLKCKRSEDNKPLDEATATKLAQDLYEAFHKNLTGFQPEPVIRIFSTINKAQFDSINERYPGKELMKDIGKTGGDFNLAILSMCADKYEFLASRLNAFLTKYNSGDREGICRILGCLSRVDCALVKEVYNTRMDYGKTLEDALKGAIRGQDNYLNGNKENN